jgi:hypothetical protein
MLPTTNETISFAATPALPDVLAANDGVHV